jgi:hypothetical protein
MTEKKKYLKPEIKKIKLDAKTAVLAVCKIQSSTGGPSSGDCGFPLQPCSYPGS